MEKKSSKKVQKSSLKIKSIKKLETIALYFTGKYRGAAHSICNLKFNVPNELLEVFHNRSIYDCYFIIKELANKFEGEFECCG